MADRQINIYIIKQTCKEHYHITGGINHLQNNFETIILEVPRGIQMIRKHYRKVLIGGKSNENYLYVFSKGHYNLKSSSKLQLL